MRCPWVISTTSKVLGPILEETYAWPLMNTLYHWLYPKTLNVLSITINKDAYYTRIKKDAYTSLRVTLQLEYVEHQYSISDMEGARDGVKMNG